MNILDEIMGLVRAHVEGTKGSKAWRARGVDFLKARRMARLPLIRLPWGQVDLVSFEERLIVYGTLKPGGRYHHLLAGLEADWEPCVIRGSLGNYRGYPSFKWNPAGEAHLAWLVTSPGLSAKFRQLDEFEGQHYTRRLIPVQAGPRLVIAYIYEGKVKA
ncbi:MAG: gamma-glutamylcyclotransferase family protein [Thermodesulfobacteriota bacterium]